MTAKPIKPASLIAVMKEARVFLARPENDFAWSSWDDATAALREIDGVIEHLQADNLPPRSDFTVLFLPTGPIQEVSLSSGWGDEFLKLAERFDAAMIRSYGRDSRKLAAHKAELAGQLHQLFGGGLRWFCSVMSVIAIGFAAYLQFSHDSVEVYFPLHLKGPPVFYSMLIAAFIFGILASVNWISWRKNNSLRKSSTAQNTCPPPAKPD